MIRLIQPEGVGLFNMIYPIYVLVLILATAGIPVAVAKIVAEKMATGNLREAYRVLYISLVCLVFSSLFFTVLFIISIPWLQKNYLAHSKVIYSLFCFTPALLIVSLCSAFRGFFQGLQQMTPTAVTQVAEQIVRVTSGLIIAYFMLPYGVEYAVMGLAIGIVCGEFMGFLLMLYIYVRQRPRFKKTTPFLPEKLLTVLTQIFQMAIPVTFIRFISTVSSAIEALLIPGRLQTTGLTYSQATAAFGQLTGIAESLLYIPSIVTASLATTLIPAVSEAAAQNDHYLIRTRIEESIRVTMLTGLPAAAVFYLLPGELCALFYGYGATGIILGLLALGAPFLYLQQTFTGILQGLGYAARPLKNLLIASAFKITGIYYLTTVPQLGIKGTVLAMLISYFILAGLNYHDLKTLIRLPLDFNYCAVKPLLASTGMGLVIWQTKLWLPAFFGSANFKTINLLLIGALSYPVFLYLAGGIYSYDLNRLRSFIKLKL
ncbi:MAG TPA: stage V sporulation protein B [Desulfotomaculum sp.]|nr:stage V sporulation protein B [Desulfotomaculum sp.]